MGYIEILGDQFYYDGKVFKVKGSNYRSRTHPWDMFDFFNRHEVDMQVEKAAELGINVLRLADTKNAKLNDIIYFLDICDKFNVKVYFCLSYPYKYANAAEKMKENKKYLKTIVGHLRSSTIILGWDLCNEGDWINDTYWHWGMKLDVAKERLRWFKTIREEIKEIDDTHPISFGATFSYSYWIPSEPFCFTLESIVDFIDFHFYKRNYRETTLIAEINKIKRITSKPILLGEVGFTTDTQYSTPGELQHNEELQRAAYEEFITAVKETNIAGMVQWCLIDHPGCSENSCEDYYGILREDFSLKPAGLLYKEIRF